MVDQPKTTYDKLKSLVRGANYEGAKPRQLAEQLRRELPQRLEQINPENEQHIKALVLLAELWDYYGKFETAKEYSASAPRILSLQEPPRRRLQKDELTQSKIRLMVAYARSLYRSPERTSVIDTLVGCREYVQKYLVSPSFPCHGTLGEIAYMLGRAYRQRHQFAQALHEFTEAIRGYEERAKHKRRTDAKKADEAQLFSEHKVAVIAALGVSWCNYTQGALRTAMYTNLVPARAILRRSNDVLNTAYADVIAASVMRALAGPDETALAEAREAVTAAQGVFQDCGHSHYAAGAALELALIAFSERKTTKAKVHLEDLQRHAESADFRWECSALIVESRILREEGKKDKALPLVTKAYDLAKERGQLLGQIDALLERSECYSPQEHTVAIDDLNRALEINGSASDGAWGWNAKVHGTCHLHLVQHFLKLNRTYDALMSFAQWQKVRDRVEHKALHQFAERVAVTLDRSERLEFRAQDGLDYTINRLRLQEFLLRQARKQHRTQEDMCDALGISRTLLNKWIAKFREEMQPKSAQEM